MSHRVGQNFEGGAGSRCPAVFSTGYSAHQGKKPGVLGAHAFFVLGTVPIKKKRLQVKPQANKHYKEALEQCRNQSCVYIYLNVSQSNRAIKNYASVLGISMAALAISCC